MQNYKLALYMALIASKISQILFFDIYFQIPHNLTDRTTIKKSSETWISQRNWKRTVCIDKTGKNQKEWERASERPCGGG